MIKSVNVEQKYYFKGLCVHPRDCILELLSGLHYVLANFSKTVNGQQPSPVPEDYNGQPDKRQVAGEGNNVGSSAGHLEIGQKLFFFFFSCGECVCVCVSAIAQPLRQRIIE